jgi:hypothetical protein
MIAGRRGVSGVRERSRRIDDPEPEPRPLRVADVGAGRLLGLTRIALFNGQNDFSMLLVGFLALWHPKCRVIEERKRVVQGFEGLHQVLIVRGMVDRLMELTIEHDQCHRIGLDLPQLPLQAC